MKVLVDMNLSPAWIRYLEAGGVEAQHWSNVGSGRAPDREIMAYAREQRLVVFTHDLDFGNILAVTHALGPSVIQVRTQEPSPEIVGSLVLKAIGEYAPLIERGALITIEPDKLRARVLPIVPGMSAR